jgi:TPR repeat protein
VDAQATLGLLLFQNNERAEGIKWLKAAADQGEPRSLLVYGTALVNGDGITQDPVLGYAMVSRAAAQGLAPAKETLAELNKLLPLDTRKKGVALALQKVKAAPAAGKARSQPAKRGQVVNKSAAPAPAVAATGPWRVQLGAFSTRGAAETLYRKLSANNALARRRAFYIPVGSMTRLQAGPFESKEAAAATCRALRTACFPVQAK